MEDNNSIHELLDSIIKLEEAMMKHLEVVDTLLELLVNKTQKTEAKVDEITKALDILWGEKNAEG